MGAYNELCQFFINTVMDSIQAMMVLFIYSVIVHRLKFKPGFVLHAILLGVVCSSMEWLCKVFLAPADMAVSTILTAVLYFLAFRYLLKFNLLNAVVSLVLAAVLYIIGSLATAALLSFISAGKLFTDVTMYTAACALTLAIFTLELFIIRIFKLFLKLPEIIRKQVFISNVSFLVVTILVIICNMNYYIYMSRIENKWIVIANCAVFLYLIYACVNVNISLLKYRDLMDKHVATVEELAVTRERNRFARDTHDTIGHTMTKIIKLLEICSIPGNASDKSLKMLNDAISYAREGLNEVRRSAAGLASEKLEPGNLEDTLKNLFAGFTASGTHIDFTMGGDAAGYNNPLFSNTIYKICQEALTNAVRHGNAGNVTVVLRFGDAIKLFICDDGTGCKSLKKGFGLSGMEQRVKELEGHINYGSNDGKGFNIFIEIPGGKKL